MNDETTLEVIYEPIYVETERPRRRFDLDAMAGALVGTALGIPLGAWLLIKTGWWLLW